MAKKTTNTQPKISASDSPTYWQNLESEMQNNQSKVSMVLGGLIVLVVIILIFNFFNKNKASLGPAQNTQTEKTQDVTVENLPGKYTVKEDDTLFSIAEKYYQDGYKYPEIAKANNLTNPDSIEKEIVLEIPKLSQSESLPSPSTSPTIVTTEVEKITAQIDEVTNWGSKITGDTYTVVEGDWLSKIAARAYGDVYSFSKIATANNISNPDVIEPGTILKIPR